MTVVISHVVPYNPFLLWRCFLASCISLIPQFFLHVDLLVDLKEKDVDLSTDKAFFLHQACHYLSHCFLPLVGGHHHHQVSPVFPVLQCLTHQLPRVYVLFHHQSVVPGSLVEFSVFVVLDVVLEGRQEVPAELLDFFH